MYGHLLESGKYVFLESDSAVAVTPENCLQDVKLKVIQTYEEHLNQYDVILLNMQQFSIEAAPGKVTEYLEQEVLKN